MKNTPYYYTYAGIGTFSNTSDSESTQKKYTIIQSLWTRPITDKQKLRDTLFIAALSLEYAHRSGFRVHMHTDSQGMALLKGFGYDKLVATLDKIPATVPTELFAAGKFYAMRAEGLTGKVHVDIDVFLKKRGVLDTFYENKRVDCICQMEEDMPLIDHSAIISAMFMLGYPAATRPNWNGSMNTGIVGFNNRALATRYVNNYLDALKMYSVQQFATYKKEHPDACLCFDFILEQVNLSCMTVGYNVKTLVPTKNCDAIADKIGYQHLQGCAKWAYIQKVKTLLQKLNPSLYNRVYIESAKIN